MPLNEDELRNVFESVALPIIMNGGIKGKWLLRTDLGDYKIDEIEDLWGSFKAAYSPEVLQALGVVLCDAEPAGHQVISKDREIVGAFGRSELEMLGIEQKGLFDFELDEWRPLYAIKEQS